MKWNTIQENNVIMQNWQQEQQRKQARNDDGGAANEWRKKLIENSLWHAMAKRKDNKV